MKCPRPKNNPVSPGIMIYLQLQDLAPYILISIIIIQLTINRYSFIYLKQMNECHFCLAIKDKFQNLMAKCCIKNCKKYYCLQCINKHFNPQFDMHKYKKQTWICYHCQQKCKCQKCLNGEDRRGRRRLTKSSIKQSNDEINESNMKENYLLRSNENNQENENTQKRQYNEPQKKQETENKLKKDIMQRISVLNKEMSQNVQYHIKYQLQHQLKYYTFLLSRFNKEQPQPQKQRQRQKTSTKTSRFEQMIAKALKQREDINDFQTIND